MSIFAMNFHVKYSEYEKYKNRDNDSGGTMCECGSMGRKKTI